jgi:hypothetical protein
MSGSVNTLAAFQVITIGRFWVIPEVKAASGSDVAALASVSSNSAN